MVSENAKAGIWHDEQDTVESSDKAFSKNNNLPNSSLLIRTDLGTSCLGFFSARTTTRASKKNRIEYLTFMFLSSAKFNKFNLRTNALDQ